MTNEHNSPGWTAIDNALQQLYPKQEPRHHGTLIAYRLGGPDPLEGISVYERLEPVPHWHYVTYGFSELHEKEFSDPEYSGYGFEITFRLRKGMESEPPTWPLNLLQNIARYVFSSGNPFAPGHYLNANGPIATDSDTSLRSLAFVSDPELPAIESPFGQVEFLQITGITLDEESALQAWNCLELMKAMSPYMPLYITDLSRGSLMKEPGVQAAFEAGIESDGSSTGSLYVDGLHWKVDKGWFGKRSYSIAIGALQTVTIANVLRGRIPKARALKLIGESGTMICYASGSNEIRVEGTELMLGLSATALTLLVANLRPRAGTFELPDFAQVHFEIVQSHIRNQQGVVVETIG